MRFARSLQSPWLQMKMAFPIRLLTRRSALDAMLVGRHAHFQNPKNKTLTIPGTPSFASGKTGGSSINRPEYEMIQMGLIPSMQERRITCLSPAIAQGSAPPAPAEGTGHPGEYTRRPARFRHRRIPAAGSIPDPSAGRWESSPG